MTVKNFIPQIWSARLLANLDKEMVYASCVNRDYEGEIKQLGDTVKINRLGDITIKDFTGTNIDTPEELTSEQLTLTIDQAKYFNFFVGDIEQAQSNVSLIDKGMGRASVSIADVIDQHIAGFVKDAGVKVGNATTPKEITVENAYDTLVDLKVELNKKNVSKVGRFVVLPPDYVGLLEKDPRFTKNETVLQNGVVGNVAGFEVRESNNVPITGGKYSILAGTEIAISHAGQIAKMEAYRPEAGFADAVKGLYVYGTKVVEPNAIACLTATIAIA